MAWFKRGKETVLDNQGFADRLYEIRRTCDIRMRTLALQGEGEGELCDMKRRAAESAAECIRLLDGCISVLREMLQPRSKKKAEEYATQIDGLIDSINRNLNGPSYFDRSFELYIRKDLAELTELISTLSEI